MIVLLKMIFARNMRGVFAFCVLFFCFSCGGYDDPPGMPETLSVKALSLPESDEDIISSVLIPAVEDSPPSTVVITWNVEEKNIEYKIVWSKKSDAFYYEVYSGISPESLAIVGTTEMLEYYYSESIGSLKGEKQWFGLKSGNYAGTSGIKSFSLDTPLYYIVDYSTDYNPVTPETATWTPFRTAVYGTFCSFSDSELSTDTYYFKVSAYDSRGLPIGSGEVSDAVTFPR